MPDGNHYVTHNYKLRSSGLMPIGPGQFLNQTFGVDDYEITTYEASFTISKSDDMAGASYNGQYVLASWQRLPYLTLDGRQVFSGNMTKKPLFRDESLIPG